MKETGSERQEEAHHPPLRFLQPFGQPAGLVSSGASTASRSDASPIYQEGSAFPDLSWECLADPS